MWRRGRHVACSVWPACTALLVRPQQLRQRHRQSCPDDAPHACNQSFIAPFCWSVGGIRREGVGVYSCIYEYVHKRRFRFFATKRGVCTCNDGHKRCCTNDRRASLLPCSGPIISGRNGHGGSFISCCVVRPSQLLPSRLWGVVRCFCSAGVGVVWVCPLLPLPGCWRLPCRAGCGPLFVTTAPLWGPASPRCRTTFLIIYIALHPHGLGVQVCPPISPLCPGSTSAFLWCAFVCQCVHGGAACVGGYRDTAGCCSLFVVPAVLWMPSCCEVGAVGRRCAFIPFERGTVWRCCVGARL